MDDDDREFTVHPRDADPLAAAALCAVIVDGLDRLTNALGDEEGVARHPALEGLYDEISRLAGQAINLAELIQVEVDRQLEDET